MDSRPWAFPVPAAVGVFIDTIVLWLRAAHKQLRRAGRQAATFPARGSCFSPLRTRLRKALEDVFIETQRFTDIKSSLSPGVQFNTAGEFNKLRDNVTTTSLFKRMITLHLGFEHEF